MNSMVVSAASAVEAQRPSAAAVMANVFPNVLNFMPSSRSTDEMSILPKIVPAVGSHDRGMSTDIWREMRNYLAFSATSI
jgi:hypothetical protein